MPIRPFVLPADLDIMNRLVLDGFQYPENPAWSVQEDERQGMIDRLENVKRMWPLMRFMQWVNPSLRDILKGFIFEEEGRPVGLVNFMKPPAKPNEWHIANVTVLPDFRRRGIAHKLVEATLDSLKERKAAIALLDVIEENLPAVGLYRELGFETYARFIEFACLPETIITPPSLPEGWSVNPLPDSLWRIRYELALLSTPENVKKYEPVKESNYFMAPVMRLFGKFFEYMGGSRNARLVLRTPNGKAAGVAFYSARTRPGGVNHASFEMHPDHGDMAATFMQIVLNRVQKVAPNRRIGFELGDWQSSLVKAAEQIGLQRRITACRMGLVFREN